MHQGHWRFASTLVVCLIVAGLGIAPDRSADAAEDCLSAPKDSTPQGKHWYYRVERHTKRHCWYLGEEGRKISQAATEQASVAPSSPEPRSSVKPLPRQSREPLQPAIANARAELTKDIAVPFTTMPPIGQQNSVPVARENPAAQRSDNSTSPNNWQVAERWPDQNSNRVAQVETAAPPPTPAPAPAQPATIQQTAPQQIVAPALPAATAAAPDDSSDMLRVVLGILTATIALAAIVGRLILSHMRPRKRPVPRRAIWQTMDDNDAAPVYARAHVHDSSLRARAEADVEELLHTLRYPEQRQQPAPVVSANRGQRPRDPSGARA